MRIPPQILEGDAPVIPNMGYPTYTDIAHSLGFLLSLVDPSNLADTNLSDDHTLTLNLAEVSLGEPQVNLLVQEGRLEVFVRLSNLQAQTLGNFSLEGFSVGLDGELTVDVSSYISLRPGLINGELILTPEGSGVAIESIRGVMQDPVAQALVDTLTSAFRIAISNWADDMVGELLAQEVPLLLSGQIDSALTLVENIPFELIEEDLGVNIAGQIGFYLQDDGLVISDSEGIQVEMDVVVEGPPFPTEDQFIELPEEITGVPVHRMGAIPWPANNEIGFAIPLSALNAALYQIWVQGAFNLDLSDMIPPPINTLIGGVRLKSLRPPLLVNTPVGDPSALALSMEGLVLTIDALTQVTPPDPTLEDSYRVSLYFPLSLELNQEQNIISLALPESPNVRISLWKQGGSQAVIEPTLIERSVGNLILPKLEDLLDSGLSIPLPSADFDLSSFLGGMSDSPSSIILRPQFSDLLRVDQGWLVISTGIALTPQ